MKLQELQITNIDYFTLEGTSEDIEISLYHNGRAVEKLLNAVFETEKQVIALLRECEVASVDLRAGAVVLKRNEYNTQMLFEAGKIFAKKSYSFIVTR